LLINFIDFKKAFDSVHRESIWQILRCYGIPEKFITIIKSLYHHSSCCIRTKDGTTEMFEIVTGVRQGCILSPFLFLVVIDFVMKKAMDKPHYGIRWNERNLTDLDFADDLAVMAHDATTLQEMTDHEFQRDRMTP
jgi:hypothetical protein